MPSQCSTFDIRCSLTQALHALSPDRSLNPRSTSMLVSTRVLIQNGRRTHVLRDWRVVIQNGRRTHVLRDWRVVSISEEDARCTDILRCISVFASTATMSCLPSGSRDAPDRPSVERNGFSRRSTQCLCRRQSVSVWCAYKSCWKPTFPLHVIA